MEDAWYYDTMEHVPHPRVVLWHNGTRAPPTRPDKPSLATPVLDRLVMTHIAVNTTFGRDFPVYVRSDEVLNKKAYKTAELMALLRYADPAPPAMLWCWLQCINLSSPTAHTWARA
jgi:hypothetical protein